HHRRPGGGPVRVRMGSRHTSTHERRGSESRGISLFFERTNDGCTSTSYMHRLIRPRERGGRTATRTQQADSAANGRALDVVITSYRAKEYLHRCLDSIRRNPPEVPVT